MKLHEALQGNLTAYESIPFWSWNDELEPTELRRQIRQMKEAGIGGFFMHARGGLTTEYLGEKWFEATAACIDEAKRLGMDAWCYDENGWPSGFAGMKLLADPANWAHYLTCEKRADFDSAALSVYMMEETSLRRVFGPAEGQREYITLYDKTNSSVVDILNPQIVRKFIAETHEKYFARFGADFGQPMQGFFTDEPQYFRWDTAFSPCMLPEYQAVYGRNLLDELGALFVDCDQAPGVRFRYWRLMNVLYTESFAHQIYDWCEAHHCRLTGHTIDENSLFGQIMCSGGVMPFYQYEHSPGIDWLGRRIGSELAPRQVSSVAQQLGKKHVLTETFACAGWDVSPRELKRIAEWQYVNGVNQMCQHLYPYSIRGQRKRDYPAFYSPHNTWTQPDDFRHFNDYFTALGYLLAESREEARVAVIHPLHAAYLTFNRHDPHSCDGLNQAFVALIERLGAAQIGHHYVDETLLAQHVGKLDDGKLRVGQCTYDYVIVPEMDTLDASTAAILKRYLANGGKLWLAGKAPHLIDGETGDLRFLRANVRFEDMLNPRCRADRLDTPVRSTYRHSAFGDFLFAVNLSDSETCTMRYAFPVQGAKRFDLENRREQPLYFEKTETGISVPLTLSPGESILLLLGEGEAVPAPQTPVWREIGTAGQLLAADENNLTLDYAAISLDGQHYTPPLPIMAVSDRMLRGKENREIYLKYTFRVDAIPETLYLESEQMGAKQVWLNDQALALSLPGKLDHAFRRADIRALVHPGENTLVYQIDYWQPQEVYDVFNGVYYEHSDGTESLINCLSYRTDLEAVYLRGKFAVSAGVCQPDIKHTLLTGGPFAIQPAQSGIDLRRIVEGGYPFFGGCVTCSLPFTATGREKALRLEGRFALAKARINDGPEQLLMLGQSCDITGQTHPGENRLTLTLCFTPRNTFGPFHFAADPEPGVSPDLFSGYGKWQPDGASPAYAHRYALVNEGLDCIWLSE